MTSRADIYRARAAECDATAAAALNSKTRTTFTELATRWRSLARRLDALEPEREEEEPGP